MAQDEDQHMELKVVFRGGVEWNWDEVVSIEEREDRIFVVDADGEESKIQKAHMLFYSVSGRRPAPPSPLDSAPLVRAVSCGCHSGSVCGAACSEGMHHSGCAKAPVPEHIGAVR